MQNLHVSRRPLPVPGMMVSEVCKDCGLRYCGGNNTLTYVSMILL